MSKNNKNFIIILISHYMPILIVQKQTETQKHSFRGISYYLDNAFL